MPGGSPGAWKNSRSPARSGAPRGRCRVAAAWASVTRGRTTFAAVNHAYCARDEQSKPTVSAPGPNPSDGPRTPPPPQLYGVPRYLDPAAMTEDPAPPPPTGAAHTADSTAGLATISAARSAHA